MRDLIIFSGQSNMQGETECISECEPVAGAVEYKFLEDKFAPLKNPVGESITFDLKKGYDCDPDGQEGWLLKHALGAAQNTNLVPEFTRSYIDVTKRDVVAVHCAKGATKICEWMPDEMIYPVMIAKVKKAISKIDDLGKVSFVWLQGESDAYTGGDKDGYLKSMERLYSSLKRDLNIDVFSVIRVGFFAKIVSWAGLTEEQGREYDLNIMSAQDEFCEKGGDRLMLTRIASELIENEKYANPYAEGHFNALGLETLGREAGKNLGEYINKSLV